MSRFLLISLFLVATLVISIDATCQPRCRGRNEQWYPCGACDSKCGIKVSCSTVCKTGSCGCKRGYVRNSYGTCMLEKYCPKIPKCGKNEEMKMCGACDNTCKGDVACTRDCRLPECGCKKGYVRNDGECILPCDCPIYPTCGRNEELKMCGACDNTCKGNVSCTLDCRPPECGCKKGYVRNDGECILPCDCPKYPTCGKNEELKMCGACDSTCEGDKACTRECRPPECGCKKGYVRNDYGECILKGDCPKYPICGKNEELKMCGACDSTCDGDKACTRECRPPECGCKKGYVRNDYGECILKGDCPKYPICGKNEELKMCGACDSTCDGDKACTRECRPPECGCKKGYVRNDYGECILKGDCPKYPICGKNEELKMCGACDSTCDGDKACTRECRPPECGCKKGYVRNDYGECILKGDCPKYPICGKNEELKMCGACDSTCDGDKACTRECRPPECGCKKGYVRNDYGECILKGDCPKYPICGKNEELKMCGACDSTCDGDKACTRECRPPECGCKKGYVRNDYGECILPCDCPIYPTCGKNEELKMCGACDNTCKGNVSCTLDCRPPECGCKKGYVRNDGECILPCDCPKYPICGKNEELKMCGACDSTCEGDKACTRECRPPECGCKKGYVRNDYGECILKGDCPKYPICGKNEELKMCGACDSTCDGDKACTRECRPPECGCKKGYVRNDGECILPWDCPIYPTCGRNEELKMCGACDNTCKGNVSCILDCRPPECGCKKGYVRYDGDCILPCDCPKYPTCGINEELKMCGACDSTCEGDKACTRDCRPPKCGCKKGYVRNKCGKCIRKCDCPKPCGR